MADSIKKDSRELGRRGFELLEPLMAQRPIPTAVARAVGFVTISYGFPIMRTRDTEKSLPIYEAGRAALRDAMAAAPSDPGYMASYAEISAWESEALARVDRPDEDDKVRKDGLTVVKRLLQDHPQYLGGLRAEGLLSDSEGGTALDGSHLDDAIAQYKVAAHDWKTITVLDPNNSVAWGNRFVPIFEQTTALLYAGRDDEIEPFLKSEEITDISPKIIDAPQVQYALATYWYELATVRLEHGLPADAALKEASDHSYRAIANSSAKPGSVSCGLQRIRTEPPLLTGHYEQAAALARIELKAFDENLVIPASGLPLEGCRIFVLDHLGTSELLLGHAQAAADAFAAAVALMEAKAVPVFALRYDAELRGELALAQLAMNQVAKAKETIAPALAFQEKFYASNPTENQEQHAQYAMLLLIDAKLDPLHAAAENLQAQRLIASLPRALTSRHSWQSQMAMVKGQTHPDLSNVAP